MGTYSSAILISGSAVLIGRGISASAPRSSLGWLAPALGFAALMIICNVAIMLPGRAWTAVGAVIVACAASVWVAARSHAVSPPRRGSGASVAEAVLVATLVLGFVSIPFLANARIGVLGISVLNDTHWHLILAEGLRRPGLHTIGYGAGYPLGPHAVAATFAQGLGTGVDKTLTGILMATPVLSALAVLAALPDIRPSRRWIVAVLAGVPYLAAAWYVQSAFKEPILSLLLIGLVVTLQVGRRDGFRHPVAVTTQIAVLIAGVLYDYSYPGLVWPVAIFGCWLLLEALNGRVWRWATSLWRQRRAIGSGLAVGGLLLVVLVAPDLHRLHTFWVANGATAIAGNGRFAPIPLANLFAPLPPLEGLNIWLAGDFRTVSLGELRADLLPLFGLIVLLFAVASALRRRELPWVGATVACALVYLYARHTKTPYYVAKALVVPGPLLVLGSGAALMRPLNRWSARSIHLTGLAAITLAFLGLSLDSSYQVLRDAAVGPNEHTNELRSLRPLLHGRPTLALFDDLYLQWELLTDWVSSPLIASPIPAFADTKLWSPGQSIDFDFVSAQTLDRFAYVITTRTADQSVPPPNFHLVGRSRSYEVWQRRGPTPPHQILPAERNDPGAILDCRSPGGRSIAREPGYAIVRPAPRYFPVRDLAPGQSEGVVLRLPAGGWNLSLPFTSAQAITVRGGGLHAWLPPNLDGSGDIWPVGRIRTRDRPIRLTITMSDPGIVPSGSQLFSPESLIAISATPPRRVPLHEACGQYVDWYVPGSSR